MLIVVELYLQIVDSSLVTFHRLQTFDLMELKDLHYQSQVVPLKDSLADLVSEFLLFDLQFHVFL